MFSCCLRTYNLMKTLQRRRTGANWPVKRATSQESQSPNKLKFLEKACRGVDVYWTQIMSCCRNSTTNFKFGLHRMGFFFKVWIYGWGGWGIMGKDRDYIHCFCFIYLKFSPPHFNPPPFSSPSLFSAGCSWITMAK